MVAAPGRHPTPRAPAASILLAVGLAICDSGPKKKGPKTVFWMPKTPFYFGVKNSSRHKLGVIGAISNLAGFRECCKTGVLRVLALNPGRAESLRQFLPGAQKTVFGYPKNRKRAFIGTKNGSTGRHLDAIDPWIRRGGGVEIGSLDWAGAGCVGAGPLDWAVRAVRGRVSQRGVALTNSRSVPIYSRKHTEPAHSLPFST